MLINSFRSDCFSCFVSFQGDHFVIQQIQRTFFVQKPLCWCKAGSSLTDPKSAPMVILQRSREHISMVKRELMFNVTYKTSHSMHVLSTQQQQMQRLDLHVLVLHIQHSLDSN